METVKEKSASHGWKVFAFFLLGLLVGLFLPGVKKGGVGFINAGGDISIQPEKVQND